VPSVVGGVAVAYSFSLQSIVTYVGGPEVSVNCTAENATTPTNASGGFSFSISVPGESCAPLPPGGEACTNFSGPYGTVTASVLPTPPAGYGLSTTANGSFFALAWVADLATVTLSPAASPVAVSTGAPTAFDATAQMANGTSSPVTPAYDWRVSGRGWSFVTPPGAGATATVVAVHGASSANLTVSASTTIGPNTFLTPTVILSLEAVSTELRSGQVNHTAIDTGTSLGVTVTATGAVGYSYTETVFPGLGLDPTSGPCATSPDSLTTLSIRCGAVVTYPAPGITQISVDVSNGYSATAWSSPNVTVVPSLAPELTPASPVGYVGVPIPISLTVAAGSGVLPYAGACFASGAGPPECEATAGPTWTFLPSFPSVANYSSTAWVMDAAGANRSVPVSVRVVGVPTVTAPAPSSPNASAGTPVTLTSSLFGGDLPAQVWWNLSDPSAPRSTFWVGADGRLSVGFTPRAPGPVRVSLTVRDSLGTDVETNLTLPVAIGPATSVVALRGLPTGPVVVGTPLAIEWQALDPANVRVPTFAGAGILSVEGLAGTPALSWVNVSGTGPLSVSPEGSFVVPPADWAAGALNVTFTALSAGALTVTLGGPGIPGVGRGLSFTSAADPAHLRLFDAQVAIPGDPVNHTYWHVSDRFGNPVPGAFVIVQYLYAGAAVDQSFPVDASPSGGTGVWLNYSLPGPGATVRVLDAAGDVLLGPTRGDAGGSPSTPIDLAVVIVGGLAVGLTAALTSMVVQRRGRPAPGPDEEAAALQLAEGRATVVEIVRAAGAARWGEIEGFWDPSPPPPDLGDWLASLVADGTLLAQPTRDAELEYRLAPPAPPAPQVVVDETALAHAVARRESLVRENEGRT